MRTLYLQSWPSLAALILLTGCTQAPAPAPQPSTAPGRLTARTFNSGFPESHDTYNGMGAASNGKIYYVLSTESIDVGAQMYSFDPATGKIDRHGDLNDACGEGGKKMISQGKSHVNFVEHNNKLYFASHIGYYSIIDGMEKPGVPPAGYKPYPGGHFLAFDMASGKFEDFGLAPRREGIITMNMDTGRGRLYGITWPTGRFLRFDMAKKDLKDFGPISLDGENGKGARYRTLCRASGLLLLMTFFVNAVAELIRQRLRDRYKAV